MRYPKFLNDNGTIGFAAPSFGCATQPYKDAFISAVNKFEELGYRIKKGPNCFESNGIGISNTPQLCASELSDMYADDNVDIIISCGGGELMCEILPYIDFDMIAQKTAKWFTGYSDNTNFTFLETILTDTASLYAPCAGAYGMNKWHQSLKDSFGILTGNKQIYNEIEKKFVINSYEKWEIASLKSEENPTAEYNLTEDVKHQLYVGKKKLDDLNTKFSGRLIGGCLDCLVNLTGTEFDKVAEFNDRYSEDGIIWFLESCDLNVFSIRRALFNLDQAGWFKNVKGFIIGRPLVFGQEMMGLDQYNAVMGILEKYNVPVVLDACIGHLPPSMPIICGSYANVKLDDGKMTLSMQLI